VTGTYVASTKGGHGLRRRLHGSPRRSTTRASFSVPTPAPRRRALSVGLPAHDCQFPSPYSAAPTAATQPASGTTVVRGNVALRRIRQTKTASDGGPSTGQRETEATSASTAVCLQPWCEPAVAQSPARPCRAALSGGRVRGNLERRQDLLDRSRLRCQIKTRAPFQNGTPGCVCQNQVPAA